MKVQKIEGSLLLNINPIQNRKVSVGVETPQQTSVSKIIDEYQLKIAKLDKQHEQMKSVYDTKLHSFYHFLLNLGHPEIGRWMVLNKIVI